MSKYGKDVIVLVRRRGEETKKARELALAIEKLTADYNQEVEGREKKMSKKTEKNREQRRKKKERKTRTPAVSGEDSRHVAPPFPVLDPKTPLPPKPLANLERIGSATAPSIKRMEPQKDQGLKVEKSSSVLVPPGLNASPGVKVNREQISSTTSKANTPPRTISQQKESLADVEKREKAAFLAARREELFKETSANHPPPTSKGESAVRTGGGSESFSEDQHGGSVAGASSKVNATTVDANSSSRNGVIGDGPGRSTGNQSHKGGTKPQGKGPPKKR